MINRILKKLFDSNKKKILEESSNDIIFTNTAMNSIYNEERDNKKNFNNLEEIMFLDEIKGEEEEINLNPAHGLEQYYSFIKMSGLIF